MAKETGKLIANNKKARFDYFIEETYEQAYVCMEQRSSLCAWVNAP